MALRFTTTKKAAAKNGIKVLVYGEAGAGKTRLCATAGPAEETLIVSCESGLLSLAHLDDITVAEIEDPKDLAAVLEKLRNEDHPYRWVCLDSVTEIAEACLAYEKGINKDPRKAYGALSDVMKPLIRGFRDLPLNVYFSACLGRQQDDDRLTFAPDMPGKTLTNCLPYLFDEVFALRVLRDDDGKPYRALQCHADGKYTAKDRSGRLDFWEKPDLHHIHTTILGDLNE